MLKMNIYREGLLEIDIKSLVKHLNTICNHIQFADCSYEISIPDRIIEYPSTHKTILNSYKWPNAECYLLITNKRYNNNYFFEEYNNLVILSLSGWEHLTTLPQNNGVAFFIANLIALKIDNTYRHNEEKKVECIYDFGWDKKGIDVGMRTAMICNDCLTRISSKDISQQNLKLLEDLKSILNHVGNASKWEQDIVEYFNSNPVENKRQSETITPKIFISYSHKDSEWMKKIQTSLKPFIRDSIVDVWSDTRIKSGQFWKNEIEKALGNTKFAILLISPDFLASDFIIKNELPPLLEAAEKGGTTVLPIIIRPCSFHRFENLNRFQAINSPSTTLIEMEQGEQERIFVKLVDDILDNI